VFQVGSIEIRNMVSSTDLARCVINMQREEEVMHAVHAKTIRDCENMVF